MRLAHPLYVIRHGETDWNREKRFQGQTDIPLNDLGRTQARTNGETLSRLGVGFDAHVFISSPLSRAAETMRIARAAMGLPAGNFTFDDRLKEVSYGDWESHTLAELKAALRVGNIALAADAIMTTDTFAKGASARVKGDGGTINIAGIAKGSGMIAPDMATMLVYIFTDAAIPAPILQKMLSNHVGDTFNAITVDSDTSTSDTLILAATGKSAAKEITDLRSTSAKAFEAGLRAVMMDLAHQVVRDGEGASKFVEVRVTGATDAADADRIARAIADSPLVKTAIAGEDPNWGRIVMAVGKSGGKADRDRLAIRFGNHLVAEKGLRNPDYSEEAVAAYMKGTELCIAVDLGLGGASRTIWTCDLTHRYIDINADYRS